MILDYMILDKTVKHDDDDDDDNNDDDDDDVDGDVESTKLDDKYVSGQMLVGF